MPIGACEQNRRDASTRIAGAPPATAGHGAAIWVEDKGKGGTCARCAGWPGRPSFLSFLSFLSIESRFARNCHLCQLASPASRLTCLSYAFGQAFLSVV